MNLEKLFKIQAELVDHIEENHPRQDGEDRLEKKILALQVELGELANELPEVFKFWSNKKNDYEKALKEYVDGLHFLLDIGLELGIGSKDIKVENDYRGDTPTETFNLLFSYISNLRTFIFDVTIPATITNEDIKELYHELFECFVGLGEIDLGFTWEQIENAYLEKNKINHERQESGY